MYAFFPFGTEGSSRSVGRCLSAVICAGRQRVGYQNRVKVRIAVSTSSPIGYLKCGRSSGSFETAPHQTNRGRHWGPEVEALITASVTQTAAVNVAIT